MFSQTVEYALRAVVFLASDPSTAHTTQQIAAVTQVPQAYLSKVLQQLAASGIVKAQRGIGGGFKLIESPKNLNILEVVNAVEPLKRIRTCPLGLASHGVNLCPLHRRMDDAIAKVESVFSGTTLAEVLEESPQRVPLCDFPKSPSKKRRKKARHS